MRVSVPLRWLNGFKVDGVPGKMRGFPSAWGAIARMPYRRAMSRPRGQKAASSAKQRMPINRRSLR
ncbi:hypothetical protein MPLB_2100014 [Mesorhizobium sp. ORS 3324]|nr:hypothetical protein MPLB_2100014 [Mesorhizobium sp. ORS 3324]